MHEEILKKVEQIYIKILKLSGAFDKTKTFLELGGGSILATQLQMSIYKEFKVKVKLKDLYKYNNIEKLSKLIFSLCKNKEEENISKEKVETVVSNDKEEKFPLKDMQKAYLIGRKKEVELGGEPTHAYCEIECDEYIHDRFVNAVNKLIYSHDILRYKFFEDGNQLLVKDIGKIEVPLNDIRKLNEEEKKIYLLKKREEIFNHKFDISKPPLVYFEVTKIDDKKAIIHFCHDGLVVDGWSHENIVRDLDYFYINEESEVLKLNCNYKMYCKYLQDLKKTKEYEEDKEFWLKWSENMPKNPDIAREKEASEIINVKTRQVFRKFSKKDYDILKEYAQKNEISPFAILLTMYGKSIARCSKNQRFLLNIPMALRPNISDDIWRMVGECSNFMLFDFDNKKDETFIETAKKVNNNILELLEHNSFSGIDFVGELQKKNGGNIIAPIVFTSTIDIPFKKSEKLIKTYSKTHTSQVWIDAVLMHCQDDIMLIMDCVDEMISEDTGNFIADSFMDMFNSLVEDEKAWSKRTSVNLNKKSALIIKDINNTFEKVSVSSVGKIINDSLKNNKDKTAIGFIDGKITYDKLYKYAGSVSLYIEENTILKKDKQKRIGILMKKGWEAIVAEVSCVMSNYAFMPIENTLHINNILDCIKKAELDCIITDNKFIDKVKEISDFNIINFNNINLENFKDNYYKESNEDDICYIINTSGSTGNPKSISIENKGLASCLVHTNKIFNINSNDRGLAVTNLCHDMSIYDVLGILSAGGAVIVPSDDKQKDPSHWLELIEKYNINLWNSVPAFMEMFVEAEMNISSKIKDNMKVIFLGGDWIKPSMVKKVREIFPNSKIISVGGPSETTLWNIYHEIKKEDIKKEVIPYGRPFPNTKYYILNDNMEICPIGVEGTMYVSGIGLAREYLGQVEETNKKFISWNNERVYNTGDCGYYREDGEIIFTGRRDFQVKINGKRIELSGIEKVINNIKEINTSCVLYDKNKNQIRAYYTSEKEIDKNIIKKHILENCVDYMIPKTITYIKSMPLTVNGKIDRKKLLAIKDNNINKDTSYKTEIEESLLSLCKEVLEQKDLEINDNFFMMGGNSISAIKLITKIRNRYKVSLSIYEIMNKPYIKNWAEAINSKISDNISDKEIVEDKNKILGNISLTNMQQEMWTYQMMKEDSRYIISAYIKLEKTLDYNKLNNAICEVIKNHEVLRYCYKRDENGLPYQKVVDNIESNLQVISVSKIENASKYMKLITEEKMDMEKGLLYKFTLFKLDNNKSILMITMHHIIADEQTFNIVCKEILDLYDGKKLLKERNSFESYIKIKEEESNEENKYETKAIKEYDVNKFRVNYLKENKPIIKNISLDENIMKKVKALSLSKAISVFDILLSAYALNICKYFNEEEVFISVPVSDRLVGDFENTVGLFLSKIAVRVKFNKNDSIIENLQKVKSSVIESYSQTSEAFNKEVKLQGLDRKVKEIHNSLIFDMIDSKKEFHYGELKYIVEKEENSLSDFQMLIEKRKDSYVARITSGSGNINNEFINSFIIEYNNLLNNICDKYNEKLSSIFERKVESFKEEIHETIIEAFLKNVKEIPKNKAVEGLEGSYTYKELYEEVIKIAYKLQKSGVNKGDIVAVYCKQNPKTIAAIYATLYVGAVYVPIECSLPKERVQYIIKDCKAKYFITTEKTPYDVSINIIAITKNQETIEKIPEMKCDDIEQIAYIMYTSGSTGNPKGVPIKERGIMNLCKWYKEEMKITYDSKMILLNNFGFDGSVKTLFSSIVSGATLVMAIDKLYEIPKVLNIIERFKVTHMAAVPSLLNEVVRESKNNDYKELESVKCVVSGGESIKGNELLNWRNAKSNKVRIVNVYGPAECACISTAHEVTNEELQSKQIPIGKAIKNKIVYILDENKEICKQNEVGTIWVSGEGIFEHYIGKNISESNLRKDIFSKEGYMYFTGDLGKVDEKNNIIFMGRVDNQIKINGQRIEIEEIEKSLCKHPDISECAFKVFENNDKKLNVIFYVSKNKNIEADECRKFMSKYIIDSLLPQKYVKVDSIPHNLNGKVDREKLKYDITEKKKGKRKSLGKKNSYMINKVSNAWKKTLGTDEIVTNAGFLEQGGTSLLYYRLQAELKKEIGLEITINDILTYSNIEEMAAYFDKLKIK